MLPKRRHWDIIQFSVTHCITSLHISKSLLKIQYLGPETNCFKPTWPDQLLLAQISCEHLNRPSRLDKPGNPAPYLEPIDTIFPPGSANSARLTRTRRTGARRGRLHSTGEFPADYTA